MSSRHLKTILADVELDEDSVIKKYLITDADGGLTEVATIRKFRIVQTEGSRQVNRETNHYNLQMIIGSMKAILTG
jgi:hypothetical protein